MCVLFFNCNKQFISITLIIKIFKIKKLLSIIFLGTIVCGCKDMDSKDAIEWPDVLPKYEVIFLMPHDGKANEFVEQIKLHDSKFHNKEGGPTTALRYITTGMNSGYYSWSEGPMQYEYVDEKGKIEGHQESWDSNVAPLVKDVLSTNYYSLQTPISYTNETLSYDANILEVVGFKISDKPNAGKEVRTMLHRWKNAFEAGSSTQEFRVFSPMLTDAFESDFYIVWPHESMESIETWEFNANQYLDEVYGKGTAKRQWKKWNELTEVVESSYRSMVK